jgi:cholesterol oxidase
MSDQHFHAIVIGSGFGGSVMTYRFAEAGHSVCLLERGKKYPPGSFPRSPAGMKTNFWDPSRGLHGVYNVWSFKQLAAVVSSGLGGGSLIYANVFIRKDERWFVKEDPKKAGYESWPLTRADLDPHYDRVEKIIQPQRYPVEYSPYDQTPKLKALRAAGEALSRDAPPGTVAFMLPKLAVTFANPNQAPVPGEPIQEPFPNLHGRTRSTCRLCGECDIGCNYGSKNTLDYNYLTLAARAGAELRTRSEVRSFGPRQDGVGYEVYYVEHSDGVVDTAALPLKRLTCDRLVLSAGAIGSTFLLLKNAGRFPGLSERLGHAFNGNGDILGLAVHARDHKTGKGRLTEPSFGPVITGALRFADELDGQGATGRGFYVEDAGYPEIVNWLAQDANVGGSVVRIARFVWRWLRMHFGADPSSDLSAAVSALLGSGGFTKSFMPLLGMGRDVPSGRAYLRDGCLALDWSIGPSQAYFEKARGSMRDIARALEAELSDDPLWYLSQELTVHPLGGCPMGRSRQEGVVDAHGEVFGFPGFYVADGSVMPGPVGPNPSLTIAACADHFADRALNA